MFSVQADAEIIIMHYSSWKGCIPIYHVRDTTIVTDETCSPVTYKSPTTSLIRYFSSVIVRYLKLLIEYGSFHVS
jgi:hypothetical protein